MGVFIQRYSHRYYTVLPYSLKFSRVKKLIFPLKRNFRDKIFEVSQDFSRGACEGQKFSRLKISRSDKHPRNFSPSKILGYTVVHVSMI